MTLGELTPDIALKALLDGNIIGGNSAAVKVYAQGRRPNRGLDREYIELYNNGVIRSLTEPIGVFAGTLAVGIYCEANAADGTAKTALIADIASQVQARCDNKKSGKFFFSLSTYNIVTPATTDLSTGYTAMVINVDWHTTE